MSTLLGIVSENLAEASASLHRALVADKHRWRDALACRGETTLYKNVVGEREVAASITGHVLIARASTHACGADVGLARAHPFRSGKWVCAVAGSVDSVSLRSAISSSRASHIEGDTGAELLFAFLLTCIDAASDITGALTRAMSVRATFGKASFLLSDGTSIYAYRGARPLHIVHHANSVLIASDVLTDDPAVSLPNGALARAHGSLSGGWRFMTEALPRDSRPELPFTD